MDYIGPKGNRGPYFLTQNQHTVAEGLSVYTLWFARHQGVWDLGNVRVDEGFA